MKKLTSLTSKLLILGSVMVLSLTQAQAANRVWGGGTGTGNAGNLDRAASWTGGTAPGATDVAVFQTTATNIVPTLQNTVTTWGSISVTQPGNLTIQSNSTTTRGLTLGSTTGGTTQTILTVAAGAGTVTIGGTDGVNITAANATTYTIANSSTLNINNGFALSNGSTLNINDNTTAGTSTFAGVISGTANVAIGAGQTTTFSAVNTYTGSTTVAGTLTASGTGTLNTTSSLIVNNGGKVTISAANNSSPANVTINTGGTLTLKTTAGALATTSTINLAGGTLVFGSNTTNLVGSGTTVNSSGGTIDLTALTSANETLGTLTLTGGVTTIDLGSGGKLTLGNIVFQNGASLVIDGWTGNFFTGAAGSTSISMSNNTGVTNFENGNVTWSNADYNGNTGTYDSSTTPVFSNTQMTPDGNPITPVPEPSTVFLGLGLLALLAWGGRQQLIEAGRSLTLVRA